MIFVTVGLDKFQFNRLIKYVDNLILKNIIKEEIFMQIGACEYEPKNCKWEGITEFDSLRKRMRDARIIISHAGIGSIILCAQNNKIPIIVPRQKRFREIVDNHQLEFVKEFDKSNTIIPVFKITHLKTCIEKFDEIVTNKVLRKNSPDNIINHLQDLFSKF